MRVLLAASLLIVSAGHAGAQRAIDAGEGRALVATSAGAAIAIGSLGIGGAMLALNEGEAQRKVGAYTLLTGLALAPITSHLISGEWARAAWFGAVPVLATFSAAFMIERSPVLLGHGELVERRVLTLSFGVALLSCAVGLFDSLNAGQRARERTQALAIAPWLARDRYGVALGGTL